MDQNVNSNTVGIWRFFILFIFIIFTVMPVFGQGLTTGSLNGIVTDSEGEPLPGANVIAVHMPSGTQFGAATRVTGAFNIPNLRVGGPYTVTASFIGYKDNINKNIYINLGQNLRLQFKMTTEAIEMQSIEVVSSQDEVMNSDRTGAATYINKEQVEQMPSIKRSTRDLFRLDPRSDGNFSFSGKNWLYNNISLDGSYFNNPFGLDDPAPGGQTNAEPVPFEAIEQVQVSIAPYDVRQGGFTGAGINTVTKSGTNKFQGSVYSFTRNESFIGDEVAGNSVLNPDLSFNQSGFTISGPLIKNKLFFFLNAEIERREDPGSNYSASRNGATGNTVSRVLASDLDMIRQRMIDVYGYDPGAYENYIHSTDNNKLLLKLDWNINEKNNLTFRYNLLDAKRDLPPHPFAISYNNTGRGPNATTLPFQNSGYAINNELNSYALELNSRYAGFSNRLFISYNRFRDFRDPFSKPFPTIEIGKDGIAYTTLGHEPFSINNLLDQDVWQFTNNFNFYKGNHVFTLGANFEMFKFNNSFNLFYYGVFPIPGQFGGWTFDSVDDFMNATDPANPNFRDFNAEVQNQTAPFKLDETDVGQLAFYGQDEFQLSPNLTLTAGLRVDVPIYFTDIPRNEYVEGLNLVDENGNPEKIDVSKFPDTALLFSPRLGFNWDVNGDRSMQLRGGTGIFTGRLPFVWIGNQVANQGPAAKFYSFDVNGTVADFKWPQVWKTNIAIDKELPWEMLGTLEFLYGKDLNAVYVRNANLANPIGTIGGSDGRVKYDPANNRLNNIGGGDVYILDNTDEGYHMNLTAQLRKNFMNSLNTSLAYNFTEAKNTLSSTEIASFLWQFNPTQGNPNKPYLSFSEFGYRHRFIASATYTKNWSARHKTQFGLFVELAEGNRYSYLYAGDLNGDGIGGNDLLYVPEDANDINFAPITNDNGNVISTVEEQRAAFNTFVEQDDYLSANRGKITERNGATSPWFNNIDARIMQDFSMNLKGKKHAFQLSLDVLNLGNLLNSNWGVRQDANVAAKSPLLFTGNFDAQGAPIFNYTGGTMKTFLDNLSLISRWQVQVGLKYYFD